LSNIVYLGLGSNLGDRRKNIDQALQLLTRQRVTPLVLSSVLETVPQGGPPQGLYLNAVLKAETLLSPERLLEVVLGIEADLGRVRTEKNGPRVIDIDILLYSDLVLETPLLTIPHPRMLERDFVMCPLREVFPDFSPETR
jgi:2-amino-4-hydroxy-6-hydroxymethyldihydropteridine diphosphokinase